jgi:hypothetical protein
MGAMMVAARVETGPRWSTLLDVLAFIEGLPPGISGLVSFGADGAGGILVEDRRVCWAVARGLKRRLTDLLAERSELSSVDLDELYTQSRIAGVPIGQVMVERGLLAPRVLDIALRRHTAESLVALCRSDEPVRWAPRGGGGYHARFTYRPVDLVFDVVGLEHRAVQLDAQATLAGFAGPGRRGVAFLADDDVRPMIPIAELAAEPLEGSATDAGADPDGGLSLGDMFGLADRARAVWFASRELAAFPDFTITTAASGASTAIWWRGSIVYAVVCSDRRSLAAVTATLMGHAR